MIRIAALLFCASLFAPLAAQADPMPRPSVVVAGGVVRLGDIFLDAGPQAAEAVAVAPAPGMRVTYGSDWLVAVARQHHLAWFPVSAYDQVSIERASRVLGSDAIAGQLLAALATRQPLPEAELQLDNPAFRLVIAAEAPDTLAIDGLTFDARTGRFAAVIGASADDPAAPRQRVSGRVVFTTELPVLAHAIAPGEVITAADLQPLRLRRDRLAVDTITDTAQLVGKTPRRALQPNQPVRTGDVQAPLLIRKGELVTLMLQTPMLQLTAQGKALEDGAMGANIRIENSKSSRVIDAVVTGSGTAVVMPPPQAGIVALNNAR